MYKYPMSRSDYNRQERRLKLMYGILAGVAVAMVLIIGWSVTQHKRDVAEINRLTTTNQKLKSENDQLHRINKEIGDERNEAIKWLESIQPGINFDGI